MRFLPRVGFALLFSVALASVLGSCTHRGTPAPIPSLTVAPTQRTVFVNAKTGNDTTGNGSQTTPYKTITKALKAVASPGPIPVLDIEVAAGDYNTANGEVFPLVVPSVMGLVVNGSLYGRGTSKGTFIDGSGEDVAYEKTISAAAGSYYTTIAIASTVQMSITNLYVGSSHPKVPGSATYDSIDLLGQLTGTTASFDAPPAQGSPRLNGVLAAGGTLTCASCSIGGKSYAIAAFAVSSTTCGGSSASTNCPTVTLTGPSMTGQGLIGGAIGIRTDGNAIVTVSNQTFSNGLTAFSDDYPALVTGAQPVAADFGQGQGSSTGNNVLIGAATEISLTLPDDAVDAFGDTWNPTAQGTNKHGQFTADQIFAPGDSGRNVTIAASANGSHVHAGPFKQPTASPSTSPSGSPSGSPSASPTASPSP
jgi:Protein of unknown function (DUF1565)